MQGLSLSRREFLKGAAAFATSAAVARGAIDLVELPFENGARPLVKYPQKRPLLRVTSRPPQLETPFDVFNDNVITPNDAFFVRYHLTLSPPAEEVLAPEKFRLNVKGKVNTPLTLSIDDLKKFDPMEVVAVNQCSGNSRGFFQPRVSGGQLGNGAMGNAKWKGARLKDVLDKAAIAQGAKQVTFNGLDNPLIPTTPDFIKAIDIDQALDGECILAYEMNGEELPWLNGYPLRLVVPGHYGTYWVKHLNEITVLDEQYKGYWMDPAYRIPANDCACVEPGTKPTKSVPITRFNVRSFMTSHLDGAQVKADNEIRIKGIAFDGGYGITEVLFSDDGGKIWHATNLGPDLGKYSFREWSINYKPRPGQHALKIKATNRIGQTQPMGALWNPTGYMRNVVETVNITAA